MFQRGTALLVFVLSCCSSYLFSIDYSNSWEQYQSQVLTEQKNFSGWCPLDKAKTIMDIILHNHSEVCVEVGVYGGSSFYPLAATLAYKKQGKAFAIDPWENDPCLEGYQEGVDDKMFKYWGKIDLEEVMKKFVDDMERNNLSSVYSLLRLSSSEAVALFDEGSIDFLHIDGNHSEQVSIQDVNSWLPKVKSGGIICFDDAWWESTQKAILILKQSCELMKKESSPKGQYIFLRKY